MSRCGSGRNPTSGQSGARAKHVSRLLLRKGVRTALLLIAAVVAIVLTWFGVPVEYSIPADQLFRIKSAQENIYSYRLRWDGWPLKLAVDEINSLGDYTLYEDGRVLGPPHASAMAIEEHGAGHHTAWGQVLHFSTSDNTDPRSNGRDYLLTIRAYLPTLFTLLVVAVLLLPVLIHIVRTLADDYVELKQRNHKTRVSLLLFVGLIDVAVVLTWIFPPNATLDITPESISHQFGHAFEVTEVSDLPRVYKLMAEPVGLLRLEHTVFEDGDKLGPGHVLPQHIRDTGGGAKRHVSNRLLFSSSDNLDPRTTGRAYRLEVRGLWALPAVLLLLGSNLILVLMYRAPFWRLLQFHHVPIWRFLERCGDSLMRIPRTVWPTLFPLLTWVASVLLLTPLFMSRDGVAHRTFLSGKQFLFEESGHKYVFLHPALSALLAPPTRALGEYGIDVFSLFLQLGVFIPHVLLMLLIRDTKVSRGMYLSAAVLTSVLFFPFYAQLQFTHSSALLVISSILFLTRMRDPDKQISTAQLVLALLGLSVGILIRPTLSLFFIVLSTAWVGSEIVIFREPMQIARLLRVALCFLVIGITATASLGVRDDPYWQYNHLRGTITDLYSSSEPGKGPFEYTDLSIGELLDRAGLDWSINDYELLRAYFHFNPAIYSAENLNKLVAALDEVTPPTVYFTAATHAVGDLLLQPPIRWGLLCLALAIVVVLSKRAVVAAVLFPALLYLSFLGLAVFAKNPPTRVTIPVMAVFTAAMLIRSSWIRQLRLSPGQTLVKMSLRTLVLFALVSTTILFTYTSMGWRCAFAHASSCFAHAYYRPGGGVALDEQHALLEDPQVIWISWDLPYEALWKPWGSHWARQNVKMIWTGAHTQAPEVQAFLSRRADADVVKFLCEHDDVRLLAPEKNVGRLRTLIAERYANRYSVAEWGVPDNPLQVWWCRERSR